MEEISLACVHTCAMINNLRKNVLWLYCDIESN
jgi:hypothetical protein